MLVRHRPLSTAIFVVGIDFSCDCSCLFFVMCLASQMHKDTVCDARNLSPNQVKCGDALESGSLRDARALIGSKVVRPLTEVMFIGEGAGGSGARTKFSASPVSGSQALAITHSPSSLMSRSSVPVFDKLPDFATT